MKRISLAMSELPVQDLNMRPQALRTTGTAMDYNSILVGRNIWTWLAFYKVDDGLFSVCWLVSRMILWFIVKQLFPNSCVAENLCSRRVQNIRPLRKNFKIKFNWNEIKQSSSHWRRFLFFLALLKLYFRTMKLFFFVKKLYFPTNLGFSDFCEKTSIQLQERLFFEILPSDTLSTAFLSPLPIRNKRKLSIPKNIFFSIKTHNLYVYEKCFLLLALYGKFLLDGALTNFQLQEIRS